VTARRQGRISSEDLGYSTPEAKEKLEAKVRRLEEVRAAKLERIEKLLAGRKVRGGEHARLMQLTASFESDQKELYEWMKGIGLRLVVLLGIKIENGSASSSEINAYLKVGEPLIQRLGEVYGDGDQHRGGDQDVEDEGEAESEAAD
jgi:hypothetical protein